MISDDKALELTRRQLARAEEALEAIRRDVLPVNNANYELMAEGYIEQIQRLRTQIDDYLGINAANDSPRIAVAGVIREVDLDMRTFSLRDRRDGLPPLDCEYDETSHRLIKSLLDVPVIVTGTVRSSRKTSKQTMEVESIEADMSGSRSAALSH
jgi:GAF domain-containing protein